VTFLREGEISFLGVDMVINYDAERGRRGSRWAEVPVGACVDANEEEMCGRLGGHELGVER
jgi:hypothetical protein